MSWCFVFYFPVRDWIPDKRWLWISWKRLQNKYILCCSTAEAPPSPLSSPIGMHWFIAFSWWFNLWETHTHKTFVSSFAPRQRCHCLYLTRRQVLMKQLVKPQEGEIKKRVLQRQQKNSQTLTASWQNCCVRAWCQHGGGGKKKNVPGNCTRLRAELLFLWGWLMTGLCCAALWNHCSLQAWCSSSLTRRGRETEIWNIERTASSFNEWERKRAREMLGQPREVETSCWSNTPGSALLVRKVLFTRRRRHQQDLQSIAEHRRDWLHRQPWPHLLDSSLCCPSFFSAYLRLSLTLSHPSAPQHAASWRGASELGGFRFLSQSSLLWSRCFCFSEPPMPTQPHPPAPKLSYPTSPHDTANESPPQRTWIFIYKKHTVLDGACLSPLVDWSVASEKSIENCIIFKLFHINKHV